METNKKVPYFGSAASLEVACYFSVPVVSQNGRKRMLLVSLSHLENLLVCDVQLSNNSRPQVRINSFTYDVDRNGCVLTLVQSITTSPMYLFALPNSKRQGFLP